MVRFVSNYARAYQTESTKRIVTRPTTDSVLPYRVLALNALKIGRNFVATLMWQTADYIHVRLDDRNEPRNSLASRYGGD